MNQFTEYVQDAALKVRDVVPKTDLDRTSLSITVLSITTTADKQLAANLMVQLKEWKAAIVAFWAPMKSAANSLVSMIRAEESRSLKPIDNLLSMLETKLAERLDIEEKERKRLEARQRAESEAAAKQIEQKRIAALREGDLDKAEVLEAQLQIQQDTPFLAVAPVPAVEGITVKRPWDFELLDMMEVCRGVVAGKIPMEAVKLNDTFVRAAVKQQQDKLTWPGIKAVQKRQFARKPGAIA